MNVKSLPDEKKLIKDAIKTPLRSTEIWQPIATPWMVKWKDYVGFDIDGEDSREQEDIDALHPGSIDNSALQGSYGDELKRGILEGPDYMLLPTHAARYLFAKYGGNTEFPRSVINMGTSYVPILQICLFPTRVEGYRCDKANPQPTKENKRYVVRYFKTDAKIKEAVNDIRNALYGQNYFCPVRWWLKDPIEGDNTESEHRDPASLSSSTLNPVEGNGGHETAAAASIQSVADKSSSTAGAEIEERDNSGSVKKRARYGRRLSGDVVDRDGEWRFFRHPQLEANLSILLGSKDCVELICESAPSRAAQDQDWPRAPLLEIWKKDLQVGDMVDAMDKHKNWWEAVVTEVGPPQPPSSSSGGPLSFASRGSSANSSSSSASIGGSVRVHFQCWGNDLDETIPADQKNKRIKPLFTETRDRNLWEEDELVDIRISEPGAPKAVFMPAKIWSIDKAKERIQVVYSAADRQKLLALYSSTNGKKATSAAFSSSSTALSAARTDEDTMVTDNGSTNDMIDDEAVKKQLVVSTVAVAAAPDLVTTASPQSDGSSDPSGGNDIPPAAGSNSNSDQVREWFDLFSEDVCPLYTHTPKPKKSVGSSLVGHASSVAMAFSRPFQERTSYEYGEKHTRGTPIVAGAVGLQNLGNTCFMNSILQCVSNTQVISDFFTSNEYKDQLNFNNPLGHKGKVAQVYAKLVKDMWSGAFTKIVPREFKSTIGEFQPQFAGYDQQDSQEFLGFLLDGLHEDCNRVIKKPHVTKIESKGREDALIAGESWKRFLKRNDSHLVECCFGQLKSHVTCKNCQKVSVTFDEFSSLSLPIPVRNTKVINATVHLLPLGSMPVKLELVVELTDTFVELRKVLIERLKELNLFVPPATGTPISPSAGAEGDHQATPTSIDGITDASDESYEIVDEGKEKDKDSEYQIVDVSSTPKPAPALDAAAEEEYHFQFGISYSTQPYNITKTFADADFNRTSAHSFALGHSHLVIFQLDRKVEVAPPAMVYNSFTRSYAPAVPAKIEESSNTHEERGESKAEEGTDGDKEDEEAAQWYTVDIAFSSKSRSYDRLEMAGHAHRLVLSRKTTTCRDLHKIAWEIVKPILTVRKQPDAGDRKQDNEAKTQTRTESGAGAEIETETGMETETDKIGSDELTTYLNCCPENRPYDLRAVSQYFTSLHPAAVLLSDDIFTMPSAAVNGSRIGSSSGSGVGSSGMESLTILWKCPLREDPGVDYNRLFAVRDIQQELRDQRKAKEMAEKRRLEALSPEERAAEEVSSAAAKTQRGDKAGKNNNNNSKSSSSFNKISRRSYWEDDTDDDNSSAGKLTIYDCIDKFIEKEQLADTETLYCSQCKQHLPPKKKMDIWAAPDTLILHLKRFQYVPGAYFVHREKINALVDFPVECLDLSKYVIGPKYPEAPPIYDLFAVSNHMGGLGGGHYTATCMNFKDKNWYNFNDSVVTPSDAKHAVSSSAYVLFYKRRRGTLKCAGIKPSAVDMPDEEEE